jgi:hypothetical protein
MKFNLTRVHESYSAICKDKREKKTDSIKSCAKVRSYNVMYVDITASCKYLSVYTEGKRLECSSNLRWPTVSLKVLSIVIRTHEDPDQTPTGNDNSKVFTCLHQSLPKNIVVCRVTIEGVCIGDSIYWPRIHSRLVTTFYRSLTHTDILMSSVY